VEVFPLLAAGTRISSSAENCNSASQSVLKKWGWDLAVPWNQQQF
jgi:hypothetical protein